MRLSCLICLAAVTAASSCGQLSSDPQDLRQQIDELRKSQEATQKELVELKEILGPILDRLPKPFRPQDVSITGSPALGSSKAKVTLVEFGDLQCPFCVKHHKETYPKIVKEFVDTGEVRYVAREFPLTQIHNRARRASQAALCAGKQNKYWEMRDRILDNRDNLGDEDLASYAQATGVDLAQWKSCLETDLYDKKVEADLKEGQQLGIQGTPAFVIGLTDSSDPGKIHATKLIEGAYPFQAFKEAIDELLGSGK